MAEPGKGSVEMQPPGCVAGDFVGHALEVIAFRDGAAERPGRSVNVEPSGLAELVNAEQVRTVAHDIDGPEIVFVGDYGEVRYGLLGVIAVGFRDDVRLGNAVREEVIATDAALREFVAGLFATEGNEEWRQAFPIEGESVAEAVSEHGGWMTVVLGGAEDCDGVGVAGLIMAGVVADLNIHMRDPEDACHEGGR